MFLRCYNKSWTIYLKRVLLIKTRNRIWMYEIKKHEKTVAIKNKKFNKERREITKICWKMKRRNKRHSRNYQICFSDSYFIFYCISSFKTGVLTIVHLKIVHVNDRSPNNELWKSCTFFLHPIKCNFIVHPEYKLCTFILYTN